MTTQVSIDLILHIPFIHKYIGLKTSKPLCGLYVDILLITNCLFYFCSKLTTNFHSPKHDQKSIENIYIAS